MSIDRRRLVLATLAVAGLLAAASPGVALADHCGADGLVTPLSGPVGTAFVIDPQLGDRTDLALYRDRRLVRTVSLHDGPGGPATYTLVAKPGDVGHWGARAWLRSQPDCRSDMSFTVTGLPDTATSTIPSGPSTVVTEAAGATLAGVGLILLWLFRRRDGSLRRGGG